MNHELWAGYLVNLLDEISINMRVIMVMRCIKRAGVTMTGQFQNGGL